jgi:hypothetical protein
MGATFQELCEHRSCHLWLDGYGDEKEPDNVMIICPECEATIYERINPEAQSTEDEELWKTPPECADFDHLAKHLQCSGVILKCEDTSASIVCKDCGDTLYVAKRV